MLHLVGISNVFAGSVESFRAFLNRLPSAEVMMLIGNPAHKSKTYATYLVSGAKF